MTETTGQLGLPGQTGVEVVRVMVERMVVGIQVEMVMTETTGQLGLPGQTC
jgi:hypothetical protein